MDTREDKTQAEAHFNQLGEGLDAAIHDVEAHTGGQHVTFRGSRANTTWLLGAIAIGVASLATIYVLNKKRR